MASRGFAVVAVLTCLLGLPASAQNNFRIPSVGSPLPRVVLYDDQGQEFSTDSLRGNYSVLVFGCLT